ncbi:MAG: glucosamine-6-phosphate isomerase [Kiritimatiellia bacterium]|nr:glucosamine-6-phosphate isomerase [Kiritimatiellia bacterium]MDP6810270.1 glucosamine-6-phosphate isomerase [Kiritimatiellia bacterium]MDP7022741.1 glucosamine-6-phosphate isomerase [Kiritimatiellia bacterium]
MMRNISKVAPDWWDYTTLDREILDDAARLTVRDLEQLSRPGFTVSFYETPQEFYCAEALEYVAAWQQATADNPVGVCGPVGPTEQLPLVAEIVNALGVKLHDAHFWGMDEWVVDGKDVDETFALGFKKADMDLCFKRINRDLVMPVDNLHFPALDVAPYEASWEGVRCALMQGGQGEVKHWAFNDPFKREGAYKDAPPTPEAYRQLGTREVDLHPITLIQNARTSGGGVVQNVPDNAITVGPKQTWMADKISIWHPGHHDNPFGMRLTALMISKGIADTAVPMSLLADHPNVHFSYLRPGVGECEVEMH